jgi:DNA-binding response OmpR family regulator
MSKRVLVVDDEPPTVRMIQLALEREGMDVATAANGAECLLAVESDQPDLVILDVMMPVLDGFETLRVLREQEETKHLPVIMLTARREDRDVLRGWMSGVDLYLTKPFQMDELVTAASRILEVAGEDAGEAEGSAPEST